MSIHFEGFAVGHGDVRLPDWLMKMDISKGAKLTYNVLAICSRGKPYTWSSQAFLAGQISSSIRTVQRHLAELVKCGLIEKGSEYAKGKIRRVYRFLTKHLGSKNTLPLKHDNLSPCPSEAQKNLSANTTKCRTKSDILSPPLIKEETIKEKYPPIVPHEQVPVAPVESTCEVAGKEGELFLELKKEDPDWTKAKDVLKNEISPGSFKTWISPLLFEQSALVATLRGPNNFFCNWVKTHFGSQIEAALATVGLSEWKLDIHTQEQQLLEQGRKEEAEKLQKEAARAAAPSDEDVDSLPLDEQYSRLYEAYPKKDYRKKGAETFCDLYTQKQLPKTSELLRAVQHAKSNNQAWQRDNYRYVPQIHNWLNASRWAD